MMLFADHLKMSSDSVKIGPLLLLLLLLLHGSGSCFLCFFCVLFWDFWKQLHSAFTTGKRDCEWLPWSKDGLKGLSTEGCKVGWQTLAASGTSVIELPCESITMRLWLSHCRVVEYVCFLVRLHLAQVTSLGCCWTVTRQQPLTGRLFHLTKSTYRHSVKFNLCGFYCWCNSSKGKMMALISLNCWHMDSDDGKFKHELIKNIFVV